MRVKVACVAVLAFVVLATPCAAWADGTQAMHRLYNPYTGEHFYTADTVERNEVMHAGWRYEGVGWAAPAEGEPVYRLYNPYAGEHHYTLDSGERDTLIGANWNDEGVGWCSDPGKAVPLYRQYNPNMFSCNHNYTADKSENDGLADVGWHEEGVAWYGVDSSLLNVAEPIVIDTPYYRVEIPSDWPRIGQDNITYKVDEELQYVQSAPDLGIGCTTEVGIDNYVISITCFTDNWGAQGDFTARLIGSIPSLQGWRVVAYTPNHYIRDGHRSDGGMTGYMDEFSGFITLK